MSRYNPRFTAFMGFVLDHEGRYYENDPNDPGGATHYGIDQRSHPNVDIRNLTEPQAIKIYYDEYWMPNKCGFMPAKLGESHFDACVNTGAGRANKFLDVSGGNADKYNDEREAFYHRLANARPKSKRYLKGWLRRVADLRKVLGI